MSFIPQLLGLDKAAANGKLRTAADAERVLGILVDGRAVANKAIVAAADERRQMLLSMRGTTRSPSSTGRRTRSGSRSIAAPPPLSRGSLLSLRACAAPPGRRAADRRPRQAPHRQLQAGGRLVSAGRSRPTEIFRFGIFTWPWPSRNLAAPTRRIP
jgi:hypothetical protein